MNIQNTSLKFLRLRTRTGLFLFSLLSVSGFSAASARADLAADNNFRPPTLAKATPPERALLLPDGRYLLFFDPDTVTDQTTGPIARFLADGTLDTSFSFSREYKTVCAAVPTADGKLYVAAIRYLYGVKDAEQILRLNSDGSIDPTFAAATVGGTDSFPDVWQLDLQADGKLLVVGFFRSFAGDATRNRIVRLMSNGTADAGFAPSPVNNDIYSVALQTDGKIVIGGIFTSVNGVTVQGITRLNADGNVDPNFQATGFTRESWPNRGIAVQPDGQILVCGRLRIGSGVATKRMPVVRLSATGALDSSFDSSGVVFGNTFQGRELAIQADGKIVAAVSNTLYRFNTTGSKDTGFRQPVFMNATLDPSTSAGTPDTVQLPPDAHIFVGGTFTDVDPPAAPNYAHFGVVRLNPDGNVDGNLVSTHHPGNETAASSFSRLGDGSTLATFRDKIDPAIPYNVARLLSDGSVDPTFTLSSSDPSRFLSGFSARGLEPLPDGNFFVYGNFGYGKVRPDGTEDTSFATNKGAPMQQAMVAPDGKILLTAGADPQTTVFTSFGRLSADGHFDNYGGPINGQVVRFPSGGLDALYVGTRVLAVQPDGKALLQYFSQDQRFHLIRLNADSSADGTFPELIFVPTDLSESFPFVFDPQSGTTLQPPDGVWSATPPVQDAYVQTDGRIILTGHFTTFGNSPARGIVRLESNGAIDASFNVGAGMQWIGTPETATFFPTVENIEPAANGKFIVTGTFEAFNGSAASGIAQLNADGSVDGSFVAPVQRDKRSRLASTFRAQPDGSFLLSGPYAFTGDSAARSLIRLVNPQPGAVNISTRLGVGTGDDALIEGFIVQGAAGSSKKMMIRAIGPSLSKFGITDALANPILEIHDSTGATVAANNDWKITQTGGLITGNQFAEINGSGLAPQNDLESVVIVSLAPGNYTAVVRGVGNTVGTGVVDAFDLDAGSAARLANIATRGFVQPDDKLMIAGFIVQNGPVKAVVRAIGPSLVQFGISNALPDTTLQLRDQQGAIVLENDDWKTSQQQELESTGLQPSHDLEAALVTTIQPGQYTAQMRGKGNASGVGVVQVYFLQ